MCGLNFATEKVLDGRGSRWHRALCASLGSKGLCDGKIPGQVQIRVGLEAGDA